METLEIKIAKATGEGATKIAAFDNALYRIKLHDFNLLKLSSVIPCHAKLKIIKKLKNEKRSIGNKLYIVLSLKFEQEKNKHACAGLGWAINQLDGSGIFVEHNGSSLKEVQGKIKQSIKSMIKYRKGKYKQNLLLEKTKCVNDTVCALVVAIYEQENWKQNK